MVAPALDHLGLTGLSGSSLAGLGEGHGRHQEMSF